MHRLPLRDRTVLADKTVLLIDRCQAKREAPLPSSGVTPELLLLSLSIDSISQTNLAGATNWY